MKFQSNRNLLAYFMQSKHWVNYLEEKTLNRVHQSLHDPERYRLLVTKGNKIPKLGDLKMGVKVWDYIYDMYECVYDTDLKKSTKDRLGFEIADLLTYHEGMGTDETII